VGLPSGAQSGAQSVKNLNTFLPRVRGSAGSTECLLKSGDVPPPRPWVCRKRKIKQICLILPPARAWVCRRTALYDRSRGSSSPAPVGLPLASVGLVLGLAVRFIVLGGDRLTVNGVGGGMTQGRGCVVPMKRKEPGCDPGSSRSPVLTQGGESVAKQERRTIKATFTLGVELVTRLNAVALLRGQSRDALATAALEEAVKGLVMFDRGKVSRRSKDNDRPVLEGEINPDGEKAA
jgi:hypothetical protein